MHFPLTILSTTNLALNTFRNSSFTSSPRFLSPALRVKARLRNSICLWILGSNRKIVFIFLSDAFQFYIEANENRLSQIPFPYLNLYRFVLQFYFVQSRYLESINCSLLWSITWRFVPLINDLILGERWGFLNLSGWFFSWFQLSKILVVHLQKIF